jgi:hypothetical protein
MVVLEVTNQQEAPRAALRKALLKAEVSKE